VHLPLKTDLLESSCPFSSTCFRIIFFAKLQFRGILQNGIYKLWSSCVVSRHKYDTNLWIFILHPWEKLFCICVRTNNQLTKPLFDSLTLTIPQQHPQNMEQEYDVQNTNMFSGLNSGFVPLWNEIHNPSIFFHFQIWASNNMF
jgi:hypothetical protein